MTMKVHTSSLSLNVVVVVGVGVVRVVVVGSAVRIFENSNSYFAI